MVRVVVIDACDSHRNDGVAESDLQHIAFVHVVLVGERFGYDDAVLPRQRSENRIGVAIEKAQSIVAAHDIADACAEARLLAFVLKCESVEGVDVFDAGRVRDDRGNVGRERWKDSRPYLALRRANKCPRAVDPAARPARFRENLPP